MSLKPVPLFGLGNQGRSPNISAQSRVNLLVEVQADPEAGSKVSFLPTPGLTSFLNMGGSPFRGVYEKGDSLFIVVGLSLYEANASGTTTLRGTLGVATGRVDMVDNGEQLFIVDGTATGYLYNLTTTAFSSVVLPAALSTLGFLNGYFIGQQEDSGQFFISALYDGATWDALDFATAESDPDNLVRVCVRNGVVHLFGRKGTEFWGDSGAADFPFARIGSSAIPWGLAARWSLADFMDGTMFLGRSALGGVQVFLLVGSTAVPVSKDIDYELSTYGDVSNATAYSYMVSGHSLYQINFPNADVSWVYDGQSKSWQKAQYSTAGRHRGEIQVNFLDQPYVSDYEVGKLYLLDQDAYTDDGATIVREFTGRRVKTASWSRCPELWIEMEAGVGLQTGQGSDPQVMLQISRDGGNTWGAEIWRGFGAVGQYTARAVWKRLGRARDWVFRVRVTDPVRTVFVAAWARFE